MVQAGVWYHVALASDGSTWKLYVNGAAETMTNQLGNGNTGRWFGNTTAASPDKTYLGAARFNGTDVGFFSGVIDDARIYDRVLTASEIGSLGGGGSTSAQIHWLVADHLGTPRMVLDKTGSLAAIKRHDYLPFGEELVAGQGLRTGGTGGLGYVSDNVRQKFTSKERDIETGLDYFGARYYANTQGRLTSADDFLNDTHVDSPASWNLYTFVRNNPLKYIDPFGEEVFGTDLTDKERQKLIDDWKKKTGYLDFQFKDGKLVVNVEARRSGGSAKAAEQLLAAVNSTSIRFNLASVDSIKVAFGSVDGGTTIVGADGKKIRTDYRVSIDFGDFDRVSGDKEAKEAYSVGIVTIHEFDHRIYAIGDSPHSKTDPGPLERTYINPIRQELGLPERLHYASEPVSGGFKSFYPSGGQQMRFKLAGKEKVLRWRNDLVGGKVE